MNSLTPHKLKLRRRLMHWLSWWCSNPSSHYWWYSKFSTISEGFLKKMKIFICVSLGLSIFSAMCFWVARRINDGSRTDSIVLATTMVALALSTVGFATSLCYHLLPWIWITYLNFVNANIAARVVPLRLFKILLGQSIFSLAVGLSPPTKFALNVL